MLIQVEDKNHEVVRRFNGGVAHDFLDLCRRMADSSEVMRIVDPYTDTMFNRIQQRMLLEELNDLLAKSELTPTEVPVARQVLTAVQEAHDIGGYVMVLGE